MAVSAQQNISVSSPDGKPKFLLKMLNLKPFLTRLITKTVVGGELCWDSVSTTVNLAIWKPVRFAWRSIDETYELVVGKVSSARNHCNEMIVPLQEKKLRKVNQSGGAGFQNDGVAFAMSSWTGRMMNSYVMYDEKTQFGWMAIQWRYWCTGIYQHAWRGVHSYGIW